MDVLGIQLLIGISYGMLLFVLASGLSLIMGVMRILNLAHGSLYMIGAYVGVTVAHLSGPWSNFWLAALVAGLTGGLIGLVLERVFFSRLYKELDGQVLATLGFVYIFENLVRWIWGPLQKMVSPPAFLSGSTIVGGLTFPTYRFALIVIGLVTAVGLWLLVEKTRVGAIIRAGMDDREMTGGLGVNFGRIASAVFFLGTFMAGFAGFLGTAMSGVSPFIGMPIMLLAVIVVVVGGMGSIPGALLGAMIIGIIDSFGKAYFPDLALFTAYLAMIGILLLRPSGLLGRKEV